LNNTSIADQTILEEDPMNEETQL